MVLINTVMEEDSTQLDISLVRGAFTDPTTVSNCELNFGAPSLSGNMDTVCACFNF